MKRLFCALLALLMLVPLLPRVDAAHISFNEALDTLTALDLFRGTQNGAEEDRAPNRYESLAMLLRLLGVEAEAKTCDPAGAFQDAQGTWATPLVAYARENGLTNGVSADRFGGANTTSVRDYLTFLLRALGYTEGTDFFWQDAIFFADSIGLTHGEYKTGDEFLRRDMILTSYTALTLKLKGSDTALITKLYSAGAVRYEDLVKTRLSGFVPKDKPAYTGQQVYELASSAVFKLELYEDKAAYDSKKPSATASGFFVTSEGVAVTCYHSIDNMKLAYAITSDGKRYIVTEVLYYDALEDVAIIRISKASEDGGVCHSFPYLEIGDSDATAVGETVYSLGAPQGLGGTFASGVISAKNRVVDDPNYLCLQFTAPISSGSSGGVLLNDRCEVIGIVYAMFLNGNSLNLAVPSNVLANRSFIGNGPSLVTVCTAMEELKNLATLTASETDVTLKVGETKRILISSDCPGTLTAKFVLSDEPTVTCEWGDFTTKRSVLLDVTGDTVGPSTITVSFHDGAGNEDFTLDISVNVIE